MSKKILSILLSLTFVLALVVPANAQETKKSQFLAALLKTNTQIKKEKDLIGKYTDTGSIAAKLLKGSYEIMYDFAAEEDGEDESYGISGDVKIDSIGKKLISNITADLGLYSGDEKMKISFYSDEEKMAFSVPNISDEYYYIDRNATQEEWENSAFGEDFSTIYDLFTMYDMPASTMSALQDQMHAEVPKDLIEPYTKLTARYLNKGRFASEGTQIVETSRGLIGAEKLTLTFKSDVINSFAEELALLIDSDERLYNFLDQTYSTIPYPMFEDTDMASEVIAVYVDLLSELEMEEDLQYNIYVDNAGYIMRNELVYEYESYSEETPANVCLFLDTAGKDYLLDEFRVGLTATDGTESYNLIASSIGNNVPSNGVFGSDIVVKAYSTDSSDDYDYDYDYDDTFGLFANYKWDTNNRENNFNFTLAASDSLKNNATKIPKGMEESFGINMAGNLILDNKKNIIEINFDDIAINTEYSDYSIDINVQLKPIKASEVVLPEGKAVDLLSLTQEQLDELGEKFSETNL